ncbi:hypothetical protein RchiOBHm_Chr7g0237201 [Rosa chinensis]|uniref:Uncharacterized protein n=1 Tax=Rosa chinensis TaxID=74649 RepID=A0A2P6PH70_ROSCH|nr:hypothetical protein RchiOBHm_Chr7g0237201 [Rosa chinensis]
MYLLCLKVQLLVLSTFFVFICTMTASGFCGLFDYAGFGCTDQFMARRFYGLFDSAGFGRHFGSFQDYMIE